jgi:hypothetical protein
MILWGRADFLQGMVIFDETAKPKEPNHEIVANFGRAMPQNSGGENG